MISFFGFERKEDEVGKGQGEGTERQEDEWGMKMCTRYGGEGRAMRKEVEGLGGLGGGVVKSENLDNLIRCQQTCMGIVRSCEGGMHTVTL